MSELSLAPPEGGERKFKVIYTIVDIPPRNGAPERKHWLRIGTGFPNRDGSFNIKLDALPTNGTLHMRDPLPADELRGRSNDQAHYAQKGMV